MTAEAPPSVSFPLIIPDQREYTHFTGDVPSHLSTLDVVDTLVKSRTPEFHDRFHIRERFAGYVAEFDQKLDRMSQVIPTDGEGRVFPDGSYFRMKYSPEEVSAQQKTYRDAIARVVPGIGSTSSLRVEVAAPMNGAFNIVDDLLVVLDSEQREHVRAMWMSSTNTSAEGALASGASRVERAVDEELLTSDIVVFADDVLDSGATALRLAQLRLIRMGRPDLGDEITESLHVIEGLNKNFTPFTVPEYQPIYQRAAALCKEAGVVIAPRYSKNEVLLGYLRDEASNDGSDWGRMQTALTEKDVAIAVGQDEWLVGGMGHSTLVGMLDTPVSGDELMAQLSPDMVTIKTLLEAQHIDALTFRLCARLGGLGVLKGKAELVEDFSRFLLEKMQKDIHHSIVAAIASSAD